MVLLFYPGFTVGVPKPDPEERKDQLPLSHCWEGGIGIDEVLLISHKSMIQHRSETLRCLLALFSEDLYRTAQEKGKYVNKWLDIIACNDSYLSRPLFYSLINVVCSYDPIGWGMPYNYTLFADTRERLVDVSLQTLAVLLNYTPSPLVMRIGQESDETQGQNVFLKFFQELKSPEEFGFIFNAFTELIKNPMHATNTYLPNSTKKLGCHQEVLMLFWIAIRANNDFLNWTLTKGGITNIIDPLLHFLHEGRKDWTQLGMIHLGVFTLLLLSGEREFSVQLNKPFTRKLFIDLPTFTGSYADYMILIFYKMVVDAQHRLEALYECLLTILANISPYIKNLSMSTCMRLMNLFKYLAMPRFIFAKERNYRYVIFLLEMFNNLIQYQYEGNYNLMYSLIRNQKDFSALAAIQMSTYTDLMNKQEADANAEATPNTAEPGNATKISTKKPEGTEKPAESAEKPAESAEKPDGGAGVGLDSDSDREQSAEKVQPTENEDTKEQEGEDSDVSEEDESESKEESKEKATGTKVAAPSEPTYVPTEKWLKNVRKQLPIGTILRLLDAIIPNIPAVVNGSSADEANILEYLKNTTMVGLLPVPHAICTRTYKDDPNTNLWFTTYMWGVVYLRNANPPVFYNTKIRLFKTLADKLKDEPKKAEPKIEGSKK
eukprot:TRINITY_DN141_c0_g1_i1.p1 TRINITY_DN141_c0_g1~~TRINITY_DN141_c0_g1_i1.p1  ORF type:complete len:662 (+),score=125.54 TRINITY_DN141_c0_g1_i1:377-2362(+)